MNQMQKNVVMLVNKMFITPNKKTKEAIHFVIVQALIQSCNSFKPLLLVKFHFYFQSSGTYLKKKNTITVLFYKFKIFSSSIQISKCSPSGHYNQNFIQYCVCIEFSVGAKYFFIIINTKSICLQNQTAPHYDICMIIRCIQ